MHVPGLLGVNYIVNNGFGRMNHDKDGELGEPPRTAR